MEEQIVNISTNIQFSNDSKKVESLFAEEPIGKLNAEQLLRLKINQLHKGKSESELISVIGGHGLGKSFIIDYVLQDKLFFKIQKTDKPLSVWIQLIKDIVYYIQQSDLESMNYWRSTIQTKLQKADLQVLIETIPEINSLIQFKNEKQLTILPTKQYVLLKLLTIITSEMPLIVVISDIDRVSKNFLIEIVEENLVSNLLIISDGFFIDCKNKEAIVIQPFSHKDVEMFLMPLLNNIAQPQSRNLIVQSIYEITLGNVKKIKNLFSSYRNSGNLLFDDEKKEWIWNFDLFENGSFLSTELERNQDIQNMIVKASLLQQPFQFEHLKALAPNENHLVQILNDSQLFLLNRQNNVVQVVSKEFVSNMHKQINVSTIQQMHYEICKSFIEADITLDRIGYHLVRAKDIYFANNEIDEWVYQMLSAIKYVERIQEYGPALEFIELVIQSVTNEWWSNKGELKRETFKQYADLLLYNDKLKRSHEIYNDLLNEYDDMQIHLQLLRIYELLGDYEQALKTSKKIFELLGYKGYEKLTNVRMFFEYKKADYFLKKKKAEELSNCTDEKIKIILQISFKLANMCFKIQHKHWMKWCCLILKESIAHGITEDSAYGFAAYSVILNSLTKKHDVVFYWGKYAISLVPQNTVKHIQIRLLMLLAAETWRKYEVDMFLKPMKVSSKITNKADDWWEKYYIFFKCGLMFKYSYDIKEISNYLMIASKNWNGEQFEQFSKQMYILQYLLRTLQGKPFLPFMGKELIIPQGDLVHTEADRRHVAEQWYTNKYILCFIFERFEEAFEHISIIFTGQSVKSKESLLLSSHYQYYVLIAYEIFNSKNSIEQTELLKMIRKSLKYFKKVVKSNPEHSEHIYYLIKAVYLDLTKNEKTATEYFEEARLAAKKYSLVHDVAIIAELQARRYRRLGDLQFAASYISIALENYNLWGALKKVEILEANSQDLLSLNVLNQSKIDYFSIAMLIQTIAEATTLKELTDQTIKIVLEIMKVDVAAIFLKEDENWYIESQGTFIDFNPFTIGEIKDNYLFLYSIIEQVEGSKEPLVIREIKQSTFVMEQSLIERNVTSLLCYPIVYNNIVLGAIYLENIQISNFNIENQMLCLKLLCNQLAISVNKLNGVKELENEQNKQLDLKDLSKKMKVQLDAYENHERQLKGQLEQTLNIFNLVISQIESSKQLASLDPVYIQTKLSDLHQIMKHLSLEINFNLEKAQKIEEKQPLKEMQKLIDEIKI